MQGCMQPNDSVHLITMRVFAETAQHARPPATLLDDILWCVTDNLAAVRIDSGSATAPAALYAW